MKNWKVVEAVHVQAALERVRSGEKPRVEARGTFLFEKGSDGGMIKYPAKFIRGLAHEIATGVKLNPSKDFSGGMETVRFFTQRGFEVLYNGKVHSPKGPIAV